MARKGGALAARLTQRRKPDLSRKHRKGAVMSFRNNVRSRKRYVTAKEHARRVMKKKMEELEKKMERISFTKKRVEASRKQPSRSRKGLTPEQKEELEAIEAVARAEEAARFIAERAATRTSRKAARVAVNDLEALLGSMGVKGSHSQSHNMNM